MRRYATCDLQARSVLRRLCRRMLPQADQAKLESGRKFESCRAYQKPRNPVRVALAFSVLGWLFELATKLSPSVLGRIGDGCRLPCSGHPQVRILSGIPKIDILRKRDVDFYLFTITYSFFTKLRGRFLGSKKIVNSEKVEVYAARII